MATRVGSVSLLFNGRIISFASPWLFVFANENARIDIWTSGVLIAVTSVIAMAAVFKLGGVAQFAAGFLVGRFAVDAGLYAYKSNARQHRRRYYCCLPSRP
jgi:hypothetical protein